MTQQKEERAGSAISITERRMLLEFLIEKARITTTPITRSMAANEFLKSGKSFRSHYSLVHQINDLITDLPTMQIDKDVKEKLNSMFAGPVNRKLLRELPEATTNNTIDIKQSEYDENKDYFDSSILGERNIMRCETVEKEEVDNDSVNEEKENVVLTLNENGTSVVDNRRSLLMTKSRMNEKVETLDDSLFDSPVPRKKFKSSDTKAPVTTVKEELAKEELPSLVSSTPSESNDSPKESINVLNFIHTIKTLVKFLEPFHLRDFEKSLFQKIQDIQNENKSVKANVVISSLETALQLMTIETPDNVQSSSPTTCFNSFLVILGTIVYVFSPTGLDNFQIKLQKINKSFPKQKVAVSKIQTSLQRAIDLILA